MRSRFRDTSTGGGQPPRGRSSVPDTGGTAGDDYPLPRATRAALQAAHCDNPSLTLNRLVGPWTRTGDAWRPPEKEKRQQFLKTTADALRADAPACQLLRDALARQAAALASFNERGWQVRRFSRTTASRLVTGLGTANPLEIGLTLHRVHGYPYLPGSGLKGAALAFVRASGLADSTALEAIFGTAKHAGATIFFDSLPEPPPPGKALLDLDVINPHYAPYYDGSGHPPADYWSPIPVYLLSVPPDTRFHFAVAARDSDVAGRAAEWLETTLAETGVGGKTAAGYGLFVEKT